MSALLRWGLVGVATVGLGIDAYTHLDLASLYSFNSTGTVNEGVLFQVEAALAIAAGLYLLVRPNLISAAGTVLITGGGAVFLVLYRYVDVGRIGPVPDMHEPIWFAEKQWSLAGELIALVAALALAGVLLRGRRGTAGRPLARRRQPIPAG